MDWLPPEGEQDGTTYHPRPLAAWIFQPQISGYLSTSHLLVQGFFLPVIAPPKPAYMKPDSAGYELMQRPPSPEALRHLDRLIVSGTPTLPAWQPMVLEPGAGELE